MIQLFECRVASPDIFLWAKSFLYHSNPQHILRTLKKNQQRHPPQNTIGSMPKKQSLLPVQCIIHNYSILYFGTKVKDYFKIS
ncbi:MAG TPA: hypothetical protein DCG49_03830 [Ruminococcus sp.]|nr:hypothetical protein [Ruminococcus sp.]